MLSKQEFITTFFRQTEIPVAPSMERALGYFGVGRWVAFHRSRRLNSLCWADSRFNACRSASSVWYRFLAHPFVAPYLQLWRSDMSNLDTLDFEAKDDDPDILPKLPEGQTMESVMGRWPAAESSRQLAYAILLDRHERVVYITRWLHAFVFLTFYKDEDPLRMLREGRDEEEGDEEIDEIEILQTSDWDDEPLPVDAATEGRFLVWLDRRWNDPDQLYRLAVQHCKHRQYSEALKALRRALEIRPECGVTNWLISQVYGSLERWPDALEACQRTLQLQSTTDRECPVEAFFMWQGRCLSKLSRHSEAIKSYTLVTGLKPKHADAYHELGCSYAELGRYKEAAASYEHEVEFRAANHSRADEKGRTKLSQAYEGLGKAYFLDKRLREAEWGFRQAIGLTPNSSQAHAGLAAVCKEMGNASEAEKEQGLASELECTLSSNREQR
jgi:tetratricopeptide (TPR) repeat protein